MSSISAFLIIIIFFTSCASGKRTASGKEIEVIEYITKQYEPTATDLVAPFWTFNDKVWFKDSVAIELVRYLNIHEDAKGNTTQEFPVLNYRFSDLRKGSVYEYKNFSDTAVLLRKYSHSDSVQVVGGWGFNSIRHWDYHGITEILPDTVIGDINYKRAKISKSEKDLPYNIICYLRCDKKGTIFNMDTNLSKRIGCPLVKIYCFPLLKKGLHMTVEVKFLPGILTDEEKRVFAAWEKYAKENPVTPNSKK